MRLINAGKAIELINKWLHQTRAIPLYTSYHFELLSCIEHCPTIDAEPVVHGRIESNGDCSECGYPIPTDNRFDYIDKSEVRYCYYCGAKMEVEP